MDEFLVAKAGGTSNATPEAMEQSLGWAEQANVFVVSAPGKIGSSPAEDKVTKLLLGGLEEYEGAGDVSAFTTDSVTNRYTELCDGLDGARLPTRWIDSIAVRIQEAVRHGYHATSMLGEQLQAELYQGLGFTLIDVGKAPHDLGTDEGTWRSWFNGFFDPSKRYVLPGNTTRVNGHLETFDRGGSDISGGLSAYAIRASLNLNLTDGPAMSADPRLITDRSRLRHLDHLLYEELRELGFNGTGLMHPTAAVPLMLGNIPTEVRSTFEPGASPTLLDNDYARATNRAGRVAALSLMPDVTIVRINEPGMAEASGRLSAFEAAIKEAKVPLIDSKGDGVDSQMYFVDTKHAETVSRAIKEVGRSGSRVELSDNLTFVTLVGYHLNQRVFDTIFTLALNSGIQGKAWQREGNDISFGRNSVRISVKPDQAASVLDRLHFEIIEQVLRRQR